MNIKKGDLVQVRAYKNQVVIRRVVEIQGQTAILSTDEECRAATKERREPICIGFPLADVIEVCTPQPSRQ